MFVTLLHLHSLGLYEAFRNGCMKADDMAAVEADWPRRLARGGGWGWGRGYSPFQPAFAHTYIINDILIYRPVTCIRTCNIKSRWFSAAPREERIV